MACGKYNMGCLNLIILNIKGTWKLVKMVGIIIDIIVITNDGNVGKW